MKIYALALPAFILFGCVDGEKCKTFPSEYDVLDEPVYRMKITHNIPAKLTRSLDLIKKCYPLKKYPTSESGITFENVRLYGDRYLILYEIEGVSDVRIAFLVDSEGEVLKSFQFGTL
jgi:hypothetical protein